MKFLLVRMIFFRSSKNFHSYKKNKIKGEKIMSKKNKKKKELKRIREMMEQQAIMQIKETTLPNIGVIKLGKEFGKVEPFTCGQPEIPDGKGGKLKETGCFPLFEDESYNKDTIIIPGTISDIENLLHNSAVYINSALIAKHFTYIDKVFDGGNADVTLGIVKHQLNEGAKAVAVYVPLVPTKSNPDVFTNILYLIMPDCKDGVTKQAKEYRTILESMIEAYMERIGISTEEKNSKLNLDLVMTFIKQLGIKSPLIDIESFKIFYGKDGNVYEIYDDAIAAIADILLKDNECNVTLINPYGNGDSIQYLLFMESVSILEKILKKRKKNNE